MANAKKPDSSLVRVGCVVLGGFAILKAFELLNPAVNMLSMLPRGGTNWYELLWAVVGTAIVPALLAATGLRLIRHADDLAARISECHDVPVPQWEYAAYRLAATFCGILVLGWSAPRLGNLVHNWYLTSSSSVEGYPPDIASSMVRQIPMQIIWTAVQFTMGLYLLLGAPHLVRWQLRRAASVPGPDGEVPSNPRMEPDAATPSEGDASETE